MFEVVLPKRGNKSQRVARMPRGNTLDDKSILLTAKHVLLVELMGVDGYPVDALEKLKFMWDGYQYSGKTLKKMADELVLRGYLVTTQHPQDPSAVVYSVNNIMDVSSDFEKEDPASLHPASTT